MRHLCREDDGVVDQEASVLVEQAGQCHELTPPPVLGRPGVPALSMAPPEISILDND